MKIKNYFLSVLAIVGFIAITSDNTFAQQPQKPQETHKQQTQKKGKTENPSWMKESNDNVKNVYFPEQDMYYNVKNKNYIYKADGKWKKSKSIPSKYKNENLGNAKKVELTQNTSKPQKNNSEHKKGNSQQGQKPQGGQQNPQRR